MKILIFECDNLFLKNTFNLSLILVFVRLAFLLKS